MISRRNLFKSASAGAGLFATGTTFSKIISLVEGKSDIPFLDAVHLEKIESHTKFLTRPYLPLYSPDEYDQVDEFKFRTYESRSSMANLEEDVVIIHKSGEAALND